MKMTDVDRTTVFEIAEIESEIAEIWVVDAVFRFVVAVASTAYLIDFQIDAVASIVVLIAEIADVSIAVKKFLVFDVVKMNLMIIKN